MKKIFKTTLLTTLLFSPLMADMVFDLRAQQFSNSLEGKFKDSTYDVGESIVSTGLAYVNGYYRPVNYGIGGIQVRVKEPKPNWSITFDMYSYLEADGFGVLLQDPDGHAINLAFGWKYIALDGEKKVIDSFYRGEQINCTIQKHGNTIDIVVNGQYKFTTTKEKFDLSYVNITLSSVELSDKLNSLSISTSD